ncbi:MAG: hypothetical protein K2G85_00210 [Muribaculaceae bacterium]|nr:hypothetical protein [Muribaculaceae bacterium]
MATSTADSTTDKGKKVKKTNPYIRGIVCLLWVLVIFGVIAMKMGIAPMMKTMMATAHDLLLNTCFFLMAVCVLTGAFGRILVEFGVVEMLQKILHPVMKPLFNLPGVASLGGVMTFLSDNPAIITLSKDKEFARYFKRYQFISLTNFGTAFGMGLLVIIYMVSLGFTVEPLIGFAGAVVGCVVSTRCMQRFILRSHPDYRDIAAVDEVYDEIKKTEKEGKNDEESLFTRILNAVLDGGKGGVEVGLAIIPGVLVISTLVMMLTFGAGENGYDGSAYQGIELLPWLVSKINIIFEWLFGFHDPHLIGFPITALGAVGAALGLIPKFMSEGWVDGNAICVFTAIGMCWSGYLSTHTAMLDSLGYRNLTSKAILAHTIGGLVAAVVAHLLAMLFL